MEPWNTDDIGLLNLGNFIEYYFTDSLGDANPSDQWIYRWDPSEEYIYFNAIKFLTSEYDSLTNSDLYRVSPNNYLEQLTDTPYSECGISPSPDGKYLAYFIEYRGETPIDKVGVYLLNLNTMQSEMIINLNELDWQNNGWWGTGIEIFWHSNSKSFVFNFWQPQDYKLFHFNLEDENLVQFNIDDFDYFHSLLIIPGTNKAMMFGSNELYDGQNGYYWDPQTIIFDINTFEKTNLTSEIYPPINVIDGFGIPTFSPDNQYMAYVGSDPNKWNRHSRYYWDFLNQYAEIYIMDLSDYSTRQITNVLLGYEGHLKWVE